METVFSKFLEHGLLGLACCVLSYVVVALWKQLSALQERFIGKSETYAKKMEDTAKAAQALAAELLRRRSRDDHE